MLRGSTTLLSASPPRGRTRPMCHRHAADTMPADAVRARNATPQTASQLAVLPPKRKGRQKRRPSSQGGVCGENVGGRCAFGLCGEARGSRAGRHNTQTTPICVVKPVSQQNGQRLNALLILAFFVFFGGWYSLQIKIYYLTFNLYQPFVTTEHYRSTHRPRPCYAGGTSPL